MPSTLAGRFHSFTVIHRHVQRVQALQCHTHTHTHTHARTIAINSHKSLLKSRHNRMHVHCTQFSLLCGRSIDRITCLVPPSVRASVCLSVRLSRTGSYYKETKKRRKIKTVQTFPKAQVSEVSIFS